MYSSLYYSKSIVIGMDVAFYEGLENLEKQIIFKFSKNAELKIPKDPKIIENPK